jgi:hypothetical protein
MPKSKELQRSVFERKAFQQEQDPIGTPSIRSQAASAGDLRSPASPLSSPTPKAVPYPLERSMSYAGEGSSSLFESSTGGTDDSLGGLGQSLNDPFKSIAKFLGPDIDPRKLKATPANQGSNNGGYQVMQGKRSPPSKGCAESAPGTPTTIPVVRVLGHLA